jgi:hypothetical protein
MFDFRYHALALVAVFVALGIGLVIGVAVGDSGLVSSGAKRLKYDLQRDVFAARKETRLVKSQLDRTRKYEWLTLPYMVDGRLDGRKVAVISFEGQPGHDADHVRNAITAAGGQLASVSSIRFPLDLGGIERSAKLRRFRKLNGDQPRLSRFAETIGKDFPNGGRLTNDVRRALFDSSSGKLEKVDAIVLIRSKDRSPISKTESAQRDLFMRGLLKGFGSRPSPVVGVETLRATPSDIRWFKEKKVTSVDNIDEPSGRASLVLAVSGEAEGAFGVKSTHDAYVPETLTRGR